MSALPEPSLPPGAHRDLVRALHELHHAAGWPSLRTLAPRVGCSHTTVSALFSAPRLPSWGLLELLVEAMDGDRRRFHQLWVAASSPADVPAPPLPIAGRRSELSAVRRHLETGSGLLLVVGEAGIGKSHLVAAATAGDGVRAGVGHCLPLSSGTAFMPIAAALRRVRELDPQAFDATASGGPAFVPAALAPLLPELAVLSRSDASRGDDTWERHRLYVAVASMLGRLHEESPTALVLEDLHWADPATLDLLEHLANVGASPPILGTWRTDEPDLGADHDQWFGRLSRLRTVTQLRLPPLTEVETAEQLSGLSGPVLSPDRVRAIHARSGGLPLFSEQLALTGPDQPMALVLSETLDRRLGDLEGPAWAVAAALAIADRTLPTDVLTATAFVDGVGELRAGLRVLAARTLVTVADDGAGVALRHPLIADRVRHRMVGGEARELHARLAAALADDPECSAAEVAAHWSAAGERDRELPWRVRAARIAAVRYAGGDELASWLRVLELWPEDTVAMEDPEIRLAEVWSLAADAAETVADLPTGRRIVESALARPLSDADRLLVLRRAGDLESGIGDLEVAMGLLDEAVALHESLPTTTGFADTLTNRAETLRKLGRFAEAGADFQRAHDHALADGDLGARRRLLCELAWHRMVSGEPARARVLAEEARQTGPTDDLTSDLGVALAESDILLKAGAQPAEVHEATDHALAAASAWGLEMLGPSIIRFNVAEALLRCGDVSGAATVVDPFTDGDPDLVTWPAHLARANVDLRRGLLSEAAARFAALDGLGLSLSTVSAEVALHHALTDLWSGLAEDAVARLEGALGFLLDSDGAQEAAALVAAVARATADLMAAERVDTRRRAAAGAALVARLEDAVADPFTTSYDVGVTAHEITWRAELGRLAGVADPRVWVRASKTWDDLGRPHDAAYCRWRGGQAARSVGEGTLAGRLLARAARDARGHVPLAAAISETAGYAHDS